MATREAWSGLGICEKVSTKCVRTGGGGGGGEGEEEEEEEGMRTKEDKHRGFGRFCLALEVLDPTYRVDS
jgi:hypothetical protein